MIENELSDLVLSLPGDGLYLSRAIPGGGTSITTAIGSTGCADDEVVYTATYWLKGINASDAIRYEELIEGEWAESDFVRDDTQYHSSGGYEFYASPNRGTVSVVIVSPCMPKSSTTDTPMPDVIGR